MRHTAIQQVICVLGIGNIRRAAGHLFTDTIFGRGAPEIGNIGKQQAAIIKNPVSIEPTLQAPMHRPAAPHKIVSADFALVDPRPTPHHAAQVAVLLTKYWDSAPSPFTEAKDPQGYRYLNFIDLVDPAHGDRIIIFKVSSDGALGSYLGDYMFTGPFSAAQARELAGCVFNGACTDTDIPHLRALPYLHN